MIGSYMAEVAVTRSACPLILIHEGYADTTRMPAWVTSFFPDRHG